MAQDALVENLCDTLKVRTSMWVETDECFAVNGSEAHVPLHLVEQ
jgi:hypothetical protein